MTPQLTFRPAVADDLAMACQWYDERQVGLSNDFLIRFRDAVNELVHRPLASGFVCRDVRRFPMKQFPYGVFYRIIQGEVVVVAVLHGRQSMRRLRGRD